MDNYYTERLRELADIEKQATEKNMEWLYRILFLCSTLFGVLVSLHRPVRGIADYILTAALVFLGIGILCNGVALYSLYKLHRDNADKARQEYFRAYQEKRKLIATGTTQKKSAVKIEKFGGICLLISVCMLVSYVVSLCVVC